MIGEYESKGRGRRVTIIPAVPGAQYRITAWALGNGSRSATPAVESGTTGEASELHKSFNAIITSWCPCTFAMYVGNLVHNSYIVAISLLSYVCASYIYHILPCMLQPASPTQRSPISRKECHCHSSVPRWC